ncbi:hypothetical protein KEM52_001188, partial [Ascosphaera acerosa]
MDYSDLAKPAPPSSAAQASGARRPAGSGRRAAENGLYYNDQRPFLSTLRQPLSATATATATANGSTATAPTGTSKAQSGPARSKPVAASRAAGLAWNSISSKLLNTSTPSSASTPSTSAAAGGTTTHRHSTLPELSKARSVERRESNELKHLSADYARHARAPYLSDFVTDSGRNGNGNGNGHGNGGANGGGSGNGNGNGHERLQDVTGNVSAADAATAALMGGATTAARRRSPGERDSQAQGQQRPRTPEPLIDLGPDTPARPPPTTTTTTTTTRSSGHAHTQSMSGSVTRGTAAGQSPRAAFARRPVKPQHLQSFSPTPSPSSPRRPLTNTSNTATMTTPARTSRTSAAMAASRSAIAGEPATPTTMTSATEIDRAAAFKRKTEEVLKNLPPGIDPAAAKQILNDIVIHGDEVHWDDVAGLDAAKLALKEAVVYPFLRPDLFSGLREPARGMLLFGPPGTGKTMIARAVATESRSTFFSVGASSLTSKWHGESEKLVKALFGLAKVFAPSIIFVDEIDAILSARAAQGEHEVSRRTKTEFLVQWSDLQKAAAGRETSTPAAEDGLSGDPSRVLVLAATNIPWDIDEAARRRFVRRQYIPLPEAAVRKTQLQRLLSQQKHDVTAEQLERLVELTDGFSGSDITALAKDAAMGPLRNLGEALLHTPRDQIRPIAFQDFKASLLSIRPSVSKSGLQAYDDWAKEF